MLKRFAPASLAVLLCAAPALASDVAAGNPGERYTRAFAVDLGGAVAPADAVPALLAAGHVQLAAMCETMPGAAVRVLNPLASGAFVDIACADILGNQNTEQASGALSSETGGEQTGEARQKWSLVGAACSAITIGSALVASRSLCPRASNSHGQKDCGNLTDGGFAVLGFLCFLI